MASAESEKEGGSLANATCSIAMPLTSLTAKKRGADTLDPDYEDLSELQVKRQHLIQQDVEEMKVKKTKAIIHKQFNLAIQEKEEEIKELDQRLHNVRAMTDRLRAVIIASFYSKQQQTPGKFVSSLTAPPSSTHPTAKKYLGKAPVGTSWSETDQEEKPLENKLTHLSTSHMQKYKSKLSSVKSSASKLPAAPTEGGEGQQLTSLSNNTLDSNVKEQSALDETENRVSRFTIQKVVTVGNVSRCIQNGLQDQYTGVRAFKYRWTVFVQGTEKEPRIDSFVSKVIFLLDPSFKPNDKIVVSGHPFHLTRLGWGTFPVRIQVHFKDPRNKPQDFIHNLQLDDSVSGIFPRKAVTSYTLDLYEGLPSILRCNPSVSGDILEPAFAIEHQTIFHCAQCGSPLSSLSEKCTKCTTSQDFNISDKNQNESEDAEKSKIKNQFSVQITSAKLGCISTKSVEWDGIDLCCKTINCICKTKQSVEMFRSGCSKASSSFLVQQNTVTSTEGKGAFPSAQVETSFISRTDSHPKNIKTSNSLSTQPVILSECVVKTPTPATMTTTVTLTTASTAFPSVARTVMSVTEIVHSGTPLHVSTVASTVPQTKTVSLLSGGKISLLQSGAVLRAQGIQGFASTVDGKVLSSPTIPAFHAVSHYPRSLLNSVRLPTQAAVVSMSRTDSSTASGARSLLSNAYPEVQAVLQKNKGSGSVSSQATPAVNGSALCSGAIKPAVAINSGKIVPFTLHGRPTGVSDLAGSTKTSITTAFLPKENIEAASASTTAEKKTFLFAKLDNGKTLLIPSESLPASAGQSLTFSTNKVLSVANAGQLSKATCSEPITPSIDSSVKGSFRVDSVVAAGQKPKGSLLITGGQRVTASKSLLTGQLVLGYCQSSDSVTVANLINPANINRSLLQNSSNVQMPATTVPQSTSQTGKILPKTIISPGFAISPGAAVQPETVTSKSPYVHKDLHRSPIALSATLTPSACPSYSRSVLSVSEKQPLIKEHVFVTKSFAQEPQVFRSRAAMELALAKSKNQFGYIRTGSVKQECVRVKQQIDKEQKTIQPRKALCTRWFSNGLVDLSNMEEDANDEKMKEGDEKSMMGRKRQIMLMEDLSQPNYVPRLSVEDYNDMQSLVKAAVTRHPLITCASEKILHPYSALSLEQWSSWHSAKRTSSEWMRASAVKRYLSDHLKSGATYKGEQLWSTKKIMIWCRLHGLSHNGPGGVLLSAAAEETVMSTSLSGDKKRMTSLSTTDTLLACFLQASNKDLGTSDDDDGDGNDNTAEGKEIEIVAVDEVAEPLKKVKLEASRLGLEFALLPSTPEALFVCETSAKIDVKFSPVVLAPGVFGTTVQDMIFAACLEFAQDILQHACSVVLSSKRQDMVIGERDVAQALERLPEGYFLTSQHCAVVDVTSPCSR